MRPIGLPELSPEAIEALATLYRLTHKGLAYPTADGPRWLPSSTWWLPQDRSDRCESCFPTMKPGLKLAVSI